MINKVCKDENTDVPWKTKNTDDQFSGILGKDQNDGHVMVT